MKKKFKQNGGFLLEILKIITNLILIILIAISLYTIFEYRVEVSEALDLEDPLRLIKLYEEKTNRVCVCYSHYKEIPVLINEREG